MSVIEKKKGSFKARKATISSRWSIKTYLLENKYECFFDKKSYFHLAVHNLKSLCYYFHFSFIHLFLEMPLQSTSGTFFGIVRAMITGYALFFGTCRVLGVNFRSIFAQPELFSCCARISFKEYLWRHGGFTIICNLNKPNPTQKRLFTSGTNLWITFLISSVKFHVEKFLLSFESLDEILDITIQILMKAADQ